MKTTLLFLVGLTLVLGACSTEETLSPIWGIDFSSENTSSFAMGSVDQYKAETKTSYIVKSAKLQCAGEANFTLTYSFESGDVLEVTVVKEKVGQTYQFPGVEGENRLLKAVFNGQVLNLTNSKVVIQPRTEENKLATTAVLQTAEEVVFDGTIARVPLLK